MLPLPSTSSTSSTSSSRYSGVAQYARLALRYRQMDFEYALWLMTNLCVSPHTTFRTTLYHSRTKNRCVRTSASPAPLHPRTPRASVTPHARTPALAATAHSLTCQVGAR